MWQLFQFPLCPFSRKVRLVLGEKGIAHELVRENPWERRDEFVDLNPAGETPVLVDSDAGTVLIGSQPICEYFDETVDKMPMIHGNAVHRAEIRRLTALFESYPRFGHLAARARNIGLNLTDRLPVLKNMLMRYAMMCFFGLLFAVPALANAVGSSRNPALSTRIACGPRGFSPNRSKYRLMNWPASAGGRLCGRSGDFAMHRCRCSRPPMRARGGSGPKPSNRQSP